MAGQIRHPARQPLRLAILIGLAALLALSGLATPRIAEAQQRRGLLDMLFGEQPAPRYYRDYPEPPRRIIRTPPRRQQLPKPALTPKRATATRSVPSPVPAPPQVIAKRQTAKTILVVGDFMAGSLAGGLDDSLSGNPDLKVVNVADGSSGLVRNDHYDWLAEIGPLIDREKPAAVVAMLGSNERQPMSFAGVSLDPRTPGWVAEYERRATHFAEAVSNKRVPLIWVGMPSFRSDEMSADMAYLNDIYRKAATANGGEYVDVWDGFVDTAGAFTFSGPDLAGQPARLRNTDGITMTPAGAEKLAFFAEKAIFRLLGTTAGGSLGLEEPLAVSLPKVNAANATSTPLVSLNDPALDGGEALLGGPTASVVSEQPSPRDRLVFSGAPAPGEAGRADAFNRSGKSAAVVPLQPADPIVFRGSVDINQVTAPIKPPAPMPSLPDAIIDDWANQQKGAPAATPPAEAGR